MSETARQKDRGTMDKAAKAEPGKSAVYNKKRLYFSMELPSLMLIDINNDHFSRRAVVK